MKTNTRSHCSRRREAADRPSPGGDLSAASRRRLHEMLISVLLACCAVFGLPRPAFAAGAEPSTGSLWPSLRRFDKNWRAPNLPIPVRPDAFGWKDLLTTGGYRMQHNRLLRLYRLLDPANVRIGLGGRAYCEELLKDELLKTPEERNHFNLEFMTLGGLQYWGDEMVYCRWRIQRHANFGHYRLLDPGDVRRAWGTYDECVRAFEKLVDKSAIHPEGDEVVILLHGLLRARRSFSGMERYLREQGYEVVAVKYPSTQASIPELAAQLGRVIERIEGARRIHFVAHSLGGLVIRRYLAEHRDPRIGRFVMIATPNRGAVMAEMLADWFPYKIVTGPVGRELIGGSSSLIESLPVPWCEFAVIAGGIGDRRGYSPLIPGDDDGIVSVKETRLDGMRDFMCIPAIHILLPNHERVREATVHFFRTGSFGDAATSAPARAVNPQFP